MLSPLAYFAVLVLVCAYAFVAGRTDERVVAAICVIASAASVLVGTRTANTAYSHLELGILLVDIATFAGFTAVALRSERFWPLWVAGLQLTTLMSHLFKAGRIELMPEAYAAAARLWVYPIFLIIVIGTWRGSRRRSTRNRKVATA